MTGESVPRLRPLGIGDLLDELFAVYRRGFLIFVGIQLLIDVPSGLLASVPGFEPVVSLGGDFGVGLLLGLAAHGCAASALYLGQPTDILKAYQEVLRQRWPLCRLLLLWWTVIAGLVAVGAFAMIPTALQAWLSIPILAAACTAPFFMIGWSLSVPALILEQRSSAVGAMRRSRSLVSGAWWPTLGVLLLLLLILQFLPVLVMDGLLQLLMDLFADQAPAVAASAVRGQLMNRTMSVFTTPWLGIGVTLLYYNRRIRVEGFDLILRARDLRLA